MLYVVSALYCEAKPWIMEYGLKKDTSSTMFQIFKNDEVCLIISKQGKLNAALAVSELFHRYTPTSSDLLINLGIASCEDKNVPIGSFFICNQLIDLDNDMTYFPDMLFHHEFQEAALRTSSKPMVQDKLAKTIKTKSKKTCLPVLYDMEACGIYVSAMMFLKQHQIIFIKVVSDHLGENLVSAEDVSLHIKNELEKIMTHTENISNLLSKRTPSTLSENELDLIQTLASRLHFSVTMTHQLKQLLFYCKLGHQDILKILTKHLEKTQITPCRSKKEGKEYFEQLKHELL